MRVKTINCNEKLIGILVVNNNEGFLNFVTPFAPLNGVNPVTEHHDEVNQITFEAKEYCETNHIKLVQY